MYNIDSLPEHLKKPLEILGKRYHFQLGSKGRILEMIPTKEEKLSIEATPERVSITCPTLPAFFRGVGIVTEEARQNNLSFSSSQTIWFDFNGLMVDCSRNGVLSVSYAKELLEQLAIMGHSVFMLYMEDVYELEGEPYFGYLRGRYSKAELKELDNYARQFGIELIPCIQTLAHLDQFLMWDEPRERYLDIDNILNIGSEKVKELLEQIISQLSDTFHSRRIHIGMDEAYNLGRGRYADSYGHHTRREIMAEHLDFMVNLCHKYDMRPIIWDDMFFHYANDTDPIRIPEGIDVMYWDYYNNTEKHYEENFDIRQSVRKDIMFAGGAWRWIGYAPHHSKTIASTNAALSVCKRRGVRQVLVTSWADDGCECPLLPGLLGCVLFAEHQYQEKVDMEAFQKRLKFITGIDFADFMRQEEFDILPSFKDKATTVTLSKYIFYEDPLCSIFVSHTKTIKDDLTSHYRELGKYFSKVSISCSDPVAKATFEFFAAFGQVMSLKWNLGLNLYETYQARDSQALRRVITEQIAPLIPLMEKLISARRKEWYLTNKSYGFEVLDLRMGGILQRLKTTQTVLEQYLEGELASIPELEESRLPATFYREEGMEEIIHFNRAMKSQTPSKMTW